MYRNFTTFENTTMSFKTMNTTKQKIVSNFTSRFRCSFWSCHAHWKWKRLTNFKPTSDCKVIDCNQFLLPEQQICAKLKDTAFSTKQIRKKCIRFWETPHNFFFFSLKFISEKHNCDKNWLCRRKPERLPINWTDLFNYLSDLVILERRHLSNLTK